MLSLKTEVDALGKAHLKFSESLLSGLLPATSVSDGTLRYLSYLTVLESQPPPSLVALEEPEHSLHPMMIKKLVDVLRDASENCQILVTTHSPEFVDYLKPEEIIVVDKVEGKTKVSYPKDINSLYEWLSDFRLVELWKMRQIGGVP